MVKFIVYRKVRKVPAHVEADDFISVGLEGLIQSIDRYDPTKGATLEQYAVDAHPRRRARRAAPPGLGAALGAPLGARHETAVEEFIASTAGGRPTRARRVAGHHREELQRHRDEIARSDVTSLNAWSVVTPDAPRSMTRCSSAGAFAVQVPTKMPRARAWFTVSAVRLSWRTSISRTHARSVTSVGVTTLPRSTSGRSG